MELAIKELLMAATPRNPTPLVFHVLLVLAFAVRSITSDALIMALKQDIQAVYAAQRSRDKQTWFGTSYMSNLYRKLSTFPNLDRLSIFHYTKMRNPFFQLLDIPLQK